MGTLKSLKIAVSADVRRLEKSLNDIGIGLKNLETQSLNTGEIIRKSFDKPVASLKRLERISADAGKNLQKSYNDAGVSLKRLENNANNSWRTIQKNTIDAGSSLRRLQTQTIKAGADIKKSFDRATRSLKEVETQSNRAGKTIENSFFKGFLKANIFLRSIDLAIDTVRRLGRVIIVAGVQLQQTTKTFSALFDTAQEGQKVLRELKDFSLDSIFTYQEVITNARALRAFNIEAENITKTIEALGNISTVVGRQALPRLTLALGQVKARGILQGQEVRQFTESAVPIIEALAQSLGKSTAEIQRLQAEGRITFADVEKALFGLATGAGRFAGLLKEGADTVDGAWRKFIGTLEILGSKLIDGPVGKTIQKIIEANTKFIRFVYNIQTAGQEKLQLQNRIEELNVLIDLTNNKIESLQNSFKYYDKNKLETERKVLDSLLKKRDKYIDQLKELNLLDNPMGAQENDLNNKISSSNKKLLENERVLKQVKNQRVALKNELKMASQSLIDAEKRLQAAQGTSGGAILGRLFGKEDNAKKNLQSVINKIENLKNKLKDLKEQEVNLIDQNKILTQELKNLDTELKEIFNHDAHVKEWESYESSVINVFSDIRQFAENSTDSWATNLADAILDSKRDFKSLGDFAKQVLRDISREILRTQITRPLIEGIGGAIFGGVFTPPQQQPGGSFVGPNLPPMPSIATQSLSNNIPQYAQASIQPVTNQTTNNNANSSLNVTQNFNISTGAEINAIDAKIAQAAPLIAESAKNGIMESVVRGQGASRLMRGK